MIARYRSTQILIIALLASFVPVSAAQAHGTAITIRPNNTTEIIITFDQLDAVADSQSYVGSPYGFVQDVLSTAVGNEAAFRSVSRSMVVYLDFDPDGILLYSASYQEGYVWQPIEQKSYDRPAGAHFFRDVVCTELLGIDCPAVTLAGDLSDATAVSAIAYDQAPLDTLEQLPFVSVGDFPSGPLSDLNVYTDAALVEAADSAADASLAQSVGGRLPGDLRLTGALSDAVDYLARRTTADEVKEDLPPEEEPAVDNNPDIPFEQDSALDALNIAPGYDPRLRYITLHCTGPGVMPASVIYGYAAQKRRNKGHGYIMPDGDYIKVASIAENPNQTYATKTETCLRSRAFGTMFNIELNYNCHWRPTMTGDPTEAMLDRLAEVIAWIHKEVGPLAIVSHTYVDMGLRDGHTDPQGRNGFDWQGLYDRIERKGGNLTNIIHIDPQLARTYPISRTDRAHSYPPAISGLIPTGRDECRQYASD